MVQGTFLTSGGIRRLLGRPAALPRPDADRSSMLSSGLTASNEGDFATVDPLIGEAVRFAEQRRHHAQQFAIELVQRPDLREAPEPVQDFLLQVWTHVLAHAHLNSLWPEDDPGDFMAFVPRLLWSTRRDATLRRPGRLVDIIPGLLQQLREGLALLGQAPQEHASFFQVLETLHRPALQLCARRRRGDVIVGEVDSQLLLAFDAVSAPFDLEPVIDLDSLQAGDGAWLYSRSRWMHMRLDWVDTQGRQFMFSGDQGTVHTMTRRILQRLLKERLLRLDDPHRPLCA